MMGCFLAESCSLIADRLQRIILMQKNMFDNSQDTRRIVYMSLLVAMSIVLHTLEQMIPLPSPWIKLGISNIATLLALVLLGFQAAIIVTLLRVLIGSILFGTFLSPTFMLSLIGGMASAIVMGLSYKLCRRYFSLIGISLFGAYTHTTVVIILVYYFIIHHKDLFYLLPVFLTFSAVTGIINGIIANKLVMKVVEEKELGVNLLQKDY